MENRKLSFGMLFILFLMLFISYSGISRGTFWENPLRGTLTGLGIGLGLLLPPLIVVLTLMNRTSLYVAVVIAAGTELLLSGILALSGYTGYARVFVEATVIGLPAGLLMAWVVAQERGDSKITKQKESETIINREA
ncbi:hypothetical protein [Pyrococcus yayanosii]|uniref:Uncharacterized protein n=1 Tax=Pyrococcus yayanosii (strain CH1 / JCM 16557) TaxID=529709 RepID=F8AH12_PYRYC|nr:hypothetical protein [Pyrococcus yayanosii]AEH24070.1 hypothetical protein PYCH_03790 [Pyrococcus yayanosii CH1]